MLKVMLKFYDRALDAVNEGISAKQITDLEVKDDLARLKYVPEDELSEAIKEVEGKIEEQIQSLTAGKGAD
jgi:V/A-type H+-transporting ATPase subunit A